MRVSLLLVAILFLPFSTMAGIPESICTEKNVCFEKELLFGTEKLELRGVARFRYLYFDVYTLALYEDTHGDKKRLRADVPGQALVFHYHRDISAQKMIDGAFQNLQENPLVDVTKMESKLLQINDSYQDVESGDRYTLLWLEGRGLQLLLNGSELVKVEGEQFARDYLGIWLSAYPLSKSLKRELLQADPLFQ